MKNKVTCESLWESNEQHSDGSQKRICDLDNSHLINVFHHVKKNSYMYKQFKSLLDVINEEIELRNIKTIANQGFQPYLSKTKGNLIVNCEV